MVAAISTSTITAATTTLFVTIIDWLTIACLPAWPGWHDIPKTNFTAHLFLMPQLLASITAENKKKKPKPRKKQKKKKKRYSNEMKWRIVFYRREDTNACDFFFSSMYSLQSITCFQIFFGFVFFACNNLAFILLVYWRSLMLPIKIITKSSFFFLLKIKILLLWQ